MFIVTQAWRLNPKKMNCMSRSKARHTKISNLIGKIIATDYCLPVNCQLISIVLKSYSKQDLPLAKTGTGTFRAQDLSFPRTNSPYGELSFPRLFVPVPMERKFPGTFVPGPFRSGELSFPENESSWELSFPGPFVPRNFCSSDYFTSHWL